jgi:hypothetical protein
MKFSDISNNNPMGYEIKGREFIIFLKGGIAVKMACDKCNNTQWEILEKRREEKNMSDVFLLICHSCGNSYLQITRPQGDQGL